MFLMWCERMYYRIEFHWFDGIFHVFSLRVVFVRRSWFAMSSWCEQYVQISEYYSDCLGFVEQPDSVAMSWPERAVLVEQFSKGMIIVICGHDQALSILCHRPRDVFSRYC